MTLTDAKLDPPDILYVKGFREALTAVGVTEAQREAAMRAAQAKHGRFWTHELGKFAVQTFGRALAEQTDDPAIGLRIAQAMPHGATGVLEYAMLTAPTLRAMHAVYTQLAPVIAEYVAFEMIEDSGYTTTTMVPPAGLTLDRVIEDYRLMRIVTGARRALLQPAFSPSAVRFTYPRPPSMAPFEEAFGKGVSFAFGSATASVQVPSSVLDLPLPTAEPTLHRILLEHGAQQLHKIPPPASLAARVRQTVLANLHEGRPAIAQVAKQLSLSERTLRRRLAEEGTSFGELLDEVRASLSRVLTRATRTSGKGVAEKLGFESTSALRRAQKRWATLPAEAVEETG